MFRIKYINGDVIDSAHNVSGILGNAFHHAIDAFFQSKGDAVADGLKEGLSFIEEYPEGFIKWSKTIPNRQVLQEKFAFVYKSRIVELKKSPGFIDSELKIEELVDVEWREERVRLPIPLKGYIDWIEKDEKGRIIINDEKSCYSFSDPEKIDGKKMIQAVQYYFLVFAATGEAPYKLRFTETKYANAKDKIQTRAYDVIYEENELFFDFYLRFYSDCLKALSGEQVFPPNLDALYDNEVGIVSYTHRLDIPEEKAKLEKIHQADNITDILKKQITTVRNMKALESAMERSLVEYKNIDYSKMTIENKIHHKLMEYGIILHFDSVVEGNAFTQYCFTPSISVKMRALPGFAKDIEQALGVSGIRVVAPIPDTSLVGIEVPKKERTFIPLTDQIIGNKKEGLPIGVSQRGDTVRISLDDMPHMLVAGATGSGKSVFLNAFIQSVIKQDTTTDLYLIDPKMVELSQFTEQAKSVAYEPEEAIGILQTLVNEMASRYRLLKDKKARRYDEVGLNQIVCVIDEFADLIMASNNAQRGIQRKNKKARIVDDVNNRMIAKLAKEIGTNITENDIQDTTEEETDIETLIIRIAQKGRAAGIHLVIATQRPDSNIITGLIKANFPTKVAFATASEINSRIILDEVGAEKLLGKGDGLLSSPKFIGLKRIQGFSF